MMFQCPPLRNLSSGRTEVESFESSANTGNATDSLPVHLAAVLEGWEQFAFTPAVWTSTGSPPDESTGTSIPSSVGLFPFIELDVVFGTEETATGDTPENKEDNSSAAAAPHQGSSPGAESLVPKLLLESALPMASFRYNALAIDECGGGDSDTTASSLPLGAVEAFNRYPLYAASGTPMELVELEYCFGPSLLTQSSTKELAGTGGKASGTGVGKVTPLPGLGSKVVSQSTFRTECLRRWSKEMGSSSHRLPLPTLILRTDEEPEIPSGTEHVLASPCLVLRCGGSDDPLYDAQVCPLATGVLTSGNSGAEPTGDDEVVVFRHQTNKTGKKRGAAKPLSLRASLLGRDGDFLLTANCRTVRNQSSTRGQPVALAHDCGGERPSSVPIQALAVLQQQFHSSLPFTSPKNDSLSTSASVLKSALQDACVHRVVHCLAQRQAVCYRDVGATPTEEVTPQEICGQAREGWVDSALFGAVQRGQLATAGCGEGHEQFHRLSLPRAVSLHALLDSPAFGFASLATPQHVSRLLSLQQRYNWLIHLLGGRPLKVLRAAFRWADANSKTMANKSEAERITRLTSSLLRIGSILVCHPFSSPDLLTATRPAGGGKTDSNEANPLMVLLASLVASSEGKKRDLIMMLSKENAAVAGAHEVQGPPRRQHGQQSAVECDAMVRSMVDNTTVERLTKTVFVDSAKLWSEGVATAATTTTAAKGTTKGVAPLEEERLLPLRLPFSLTPSSVAIYHREEVTGSRRGKKKTVVDVAAEGNTARGVLMEIRKGGKAATSWKRHLQELWHEHERYMSSGASRKGRAAPKPPGSRYSLSHCLDCGQALSGSEHGHGDLCLFPWYQWFEEGHVARCLGAVPVDVGATANLNTKGQGRVVTTTDALVFDVGDRQVVEEEDGEAPAPPAAPAKPANLAKWVDPELSVMMAARQKGRRGRTISEVFSGILDAVRQSHGEEYALFWELPKDPKTGRRPKSSARGEEILCLKDLRTSVDSMEVRSRDGFLSTVDNIIRHFTDKVDLSAVTAGAMLRAALVNQVTQLEEELRTIEAKESVRGKAWPKAAGSGRKTPRIPTPTPTVAGPKSEEPREVPVNIEPEEVVPPPVPIVVSVSAAEGGSSNTPAPGTAGGGGGICPLCGKQTENVFLHIQTCVG